MDRKRRLPAKDIHIEVGAQPNAARNAKLHNGY